ncbi:MAG: acylneuraminate cytidylyltransferase [Candidatus Omnitrophota bacterium]|nr:acylneuraminate cytidylyltransferase [Candidatus Omnitrophota bacterium]
MVSGRQKVSVIIQARLGSTRLPGKAMMDLCGKTVLARAINAAKRAKTVDSVCVATSTGEAGEIISAEASKNKVISFKGSEEDVLDRYAKAALRLGSDVIVRVTADNPLTETSFIDLCVNKITSTRCDLVTMKNIPYGSGVEVVRRDTLIAVSRAARRAHDREHVTTYIYKNTEIFNVCYLEPIPKLRRPDIRVTLDTMDDYCALYKIFNKFSGISADKKRLERVIKFIDALKISERGRS